MDTLCLMSYPGVLWTSLDVLDAVDILGRPELGTRESNPEPPGPKPGASAN